MAARLYFRAQIEDRYQAVRALLETWAEDEGHRIFGQTVLIKPNCVSAHHQLASTNAEAVHAALEVLHQLRPKRLILGEGSSEDTLQAFKNFGYLAWVEKFGAEILDLNQDAFELRTVYDAKGNPISIRIAKTALTSFRVSLAKPKTHDCVIVTLGIKNLVVGAIQKPDKPKIHQGYAAINLNIALLARELAPHLSVIDGYEGMEGNGPVAGDPVPHRFALVGSNPVAVDAAATTLMGFDPREIGYLVHCARFGLGDLDGWEVVGDPLHGSIRRYRPHSTYQEQLHWDCLGHGLRANYERA
ncbi:MAG: DUF362 domain-containing protein [Candidatus Bipolaricaulota bacterium]|nr:DUF362 domain-containing protein [Candidatus Bipolaricaulota bacterium]MDW8126796.1 DUF362 domain-containing protein [Candidatus Bipolaricaulota bacterium]